MDQQEQPVDIREVLAEMSERGRLEWDLAVGRWENKQLRRRLADAENAQQNGARREGRVTAVNDDGSVVGGASRG